MPTYEIIPNSTVSARNDPMTAESQFIDAYIEALLWSSTVVHPTDDPDVGSVADDFEPHGTLTTRSVIDCREFCAENYVLLMQAMMSEASYTWEAAGRDFALTRNRHNAGFWDRDLGRVGEVLKARAKAYGSVALYLDDDEQVRIA